MDKQPLRNAQAGATQAIKQLDTALNLEYCLRFKECVSEAAWLLEQAARELRLMEQGK